jgi:hypothetical protein
MRSFSVSTATRVSVDCWPACARFRFLLPRACRLIAGQLVTNVCSPDTPGPHPHARRPPRRWRASSVREIVTGRESERLHLQWQPRFRRDRRDKRRANVELLPTTIMMDHQATMMASTNMLAIIGGGMTPRAAARRSTRRARAPAAWPRSSGGASSRYATDRR